MVKEMIKALAEERFETDITLEFTHFSRDEDDLHLTCAVFSDGDGELLQEWSITCTDYEEYLFESKEFCSFEELEVRNDHYYLWDYNKPFTELYFQGENERVNELIASLYLCHIELTERILPFEKYINFKYGLVRNLDELLSSKSGMFACAPEVLNEAYQAVLEQYGLRTSSLKTLVNQPAQPVQLLRLGKTYVVAKAFKAVRVF